jgi:hypothetical protein
MSKVSSKQPGPASAPKVRKRNAEPFVIVPLKWIERATRGTRSPRTLILIELLYAACQAKGVTFPLPSARLMQLGVTRKLKREVLMDLECRGLIAMQRQRGKAPIVTLFEV